MEFDVLAYGESINRWNYSCQTIGINHIGNLVNEIDFLLLIDHPAYFTPEKMQAVKKTMPQNFFIADMAWLQFIERTKAVQISFCAERSNTRTLNNTSKGIFALLPYSYNSPFVAAVLAIRMGARKVNLYGVDFNSDSMADTEIEQKNIRDWKRLYNAALNNNVQIFTTPESKLKNFIPINPKIK